MHPSNPRIKSVRNNRQHRISLRPTKPQTKTPLIIISADDFIRDINHSSNFFHMAETVSSDALASIKKKLEIDNNTSNKNHSNQSKDS